jgi:long-chain acyl-CoA synthetase
MTTRPWIATYGSRIPSHIEPCATASVTEMMESAMQRYGAKVAFRCHGEVLTFADVDRLSRDFAAYLQHVLGVRKGDRIAVMLPNILAFPIAMLGIVRCGAVQVNVNPLYTPRELEHQLADAGAEAIVVFDKAHPTLAQVIHATPIKHVIVVESAGAARCDAIAFATALHEGASSPLAPVSASADDLIFLQYTGGTTGLSKGAALTHGNLVANVEQFRAFVPDAVRPGREVVVTALPLYHIFALMVNFITYFSAGAENWLVPNPRDVEGFVEILKTARPSVLTGVNTLYSGLTLHPRIRELDFSRLRVAIGGGATIMPVTSQRWRALTGVDILEGYGLSETSPILTLNPMTIDGFSGTVGLPLPSTDVKLLDDQDREVPIGHAGEICAKGPQVMRGYWRKSDANAAAFTADGYFRTGDIGVFDEKGYLRIVDRKKDMILVSGLNVYPNEVEAVAASCTGIAECACIGVPDERTGEAVRLFVVKSPGATLIEDDVIAHCRLGLTPYKLPKQVRFLDALPKSAVGKILRKDLRAISN